FNISCFRAKNIICRDAIHRVPTRSNDIAILTQFAFGRKMYYLCIAKAQGRRETALFSCPQARFREKLSLSWDFVHGL
ncbi:MAG: hypothetical protein IJY00_02045, partial [Bacteroidaceae bacterium]|nr:hypothetical protein [Bacteroidaceae bacterium]